MSLYTIHKVQQKVILYGYTHTHTHMHTHTMLRTHTLHTNTMHTGTQTQPHTQVYKYIQIHTVIYACKHRRI